MARTDGLIRVADKTPEERSEQGRKGALKSIEIRRENLLAKRAATIALKLYPEIDLKQKHALSLMGVDTSKPLNIMTIAMTKVAYQAMNGNLKAFRFLLDAAHMSPQTITELAKTQIMRQTYESKFPAEEIKDAEVVETKSVDTSKIEAEMKKMGIYVDS